MRTQAESRDSHGSRSSDEAAAILARVERADRATYRSRQIVAYFGDPPSNAVVDVTSSGEGRFVRADTGRTVTRLWSGPRGGAVDGETRLTESPGSTVAVRPQAIVDKFAVNVGPREKLLGVELVPLTFARRSDGVVVERWWVHERSGVVYRRSLFDAAGKLVGMSTVVDMEWGDPGPREPMGTDVTRAPKVRASRSADAPRHLADGYALWKTYRLKLAGRWAEQWVYSDGLHALSVFSTHGHLRAPDSFVRAEVGGTEVWTGPGPGTWAWEGANRTWLVVAEESAINLEELIDPLPQGGPSVASRLASGWIHIGRAVRGLFD